MKTRRSPRLVPFLSTGVIAGFFVGGVYSFAKTRRWVLVAGLAVAAILCVIGAVLWWDPA